jgi:hypothetical protein
MRKYLTQALITESINRLEDAARTKKDFWDLVKLWNQKDKRIQNALNKKMIWVEHEKFDKRWVKKGDYRKKDAFGDRGKYTEDMLNTLYCCVCQMHNLTDDADLSRLINKATEKQKAIFFPRVICNCTPQKISKCHGMTDRNVRDIVNRMISNIKDGMYVALKDRQERGVPSTMQQKEFVRITSEEEKKKGGE